MKKSLAILFSLAALLLRAGEFTVFDAARSEQYKWTNYTQSWIKDSNLKSVTRIDGDTLEITYTGNRGGARTAFNVSGLDKLPPAESVTGFQVTLDGNAKEYDKLLFNVFFTDNTDAQYDIAMTPGMKTYSPRFIFRRSKDPINWRALRLIAIDNSNPALVLKIKSIELLTHSPETERALVPILSERHVYEVLPATQPAGALGPWTRLSDQQLIPAGESPVRMELSFQGQELIVSARSEFESPPLAAITTHDDHVFSDEALELLFSPWLDNHKFMQFTVNAAGTVFDMKRDFDMTAAGIIFNRQWTLPHRKTLSYADGVQHYRLSFPFSELGFSPAKERFIHFQAAQHYAGTRKHQTLSWNPTRYFPEPRNFGVLVFNQAPFGPGEIKVGKITALTNEDPNYLCFNFAAETSSLPPGSYRLKLFLSTPQGTLISKSAVLEAEAKTVEINLDALRQSGFYTAYLALENSAGNWKMTAVNYTYSTPLRDRFGEFLPCPVPKETRKTAGEFDCSRGVNLQTAPNSSARTRRTAELTGQDLNGYLNTGGPAIIELSVNPDLRLPPEGYQLQITPEKIILTGQDEPGLYRGTRTLLQLVKSPMTRDEAIKLPCLEIRDYPDLSNRIFRICHPELFRGTRIREFRGVEYMLNFIGRFVADQKYNILQLDLASLTRFARQPAFNGPERVYTLDDWKRIAEFCRDRFIELVPALPAGSHEVVWLLSYFPHLAMPGWTYTGDVRSPEHNRIIFDCMDDLIDATGARYFSPKFDEWYHKRSTAPLLDGSIYYDAFWNFAGQCHKHLAERNVRMLIFDDMLYPGTNGAIFDIYKGIDQLPRDIIFLHWGGQPARQVVRYFTDRGFEVWNSGTSYVAYDEETRPLLKGFGASPYSMGHSIELRDDGGTCTSFLPVFHSADVAWNFHRRDGHPTIIDRLADGTLTAWRNIAAAQPDPHGAGKAAALDLSRNFNIVFSDFVRDHLPGFKPELPDGELPVGNVPTALTDRAVLLNREPGLELALDGRLSSLTFLLGAWYAPELTRTRAYLKQGAPWHYWLYGYPAGDFIVHYQNGDTARIPMRLYESFNWLDVNSLYRATSDNRYVLPVKAGDGRYLFLYQYEWINPRPGHELKSMVFEPSDDFDFKLLLFSVSARGVR
jgi:hypothetical protein